MRNTRKVEGVRGVASGRARAASGRYGAVLALCLLACRSSARPALSLDLEVRAVPGAQRSPVVATVGDDLTAHAPGADAVWIYRTGRGMIARCPDPGASPTETSCRATGRGVDLTVTLEAAGHHRVLAIAGARDLVPTGDLDRDVLAARTRGARVDVRSVVATAPP